MQIGLGRRYAVYLSAFTLVSITLALAAAGLIAFRQANVLQRQIRDAISTVQSANEDERLRGTAQYLAGRMFNPVFRFDIERIDEEIERVRRWLPVRDFVVVDASHRVITDGTDAKLNFGNTIEGVWPSVDSGAVLMTDGNGKRQVRFAIQSGGILAGFAAVTFAEDPSQAGLRRIDEQTSNLWASHRKSLLALFLIAFAFSLLLGVITSIRLSRSLGQPLAEMGRAARAFAQGNLEYPLPTESPDELGELARALRSMSQNVRTHQAALHEETARLRRAEAERSELLADLGRKNAELERFTYTVSHDLKSPLVTIQGFAGMIASDLGPGAPEQVKRDLSRITAATDKMQSLLIDLLELSRVGRIVNPVEKVDFTELAREVVELLQGQLSGKNVEVQIEEGLPSVTVDRRRLLEVLQNLVENACKFMVPGRPARVEIGFRPEPDRAFFVRDNGQGIDPAYAERIFNIFEKLDPKAEGTGVGLSLAKRIVEAHGGRIWAESAGPGSGATFFFTLGPACWGG
ncbi:MAG: HAMP domain-containing protein [Vicinamibacteria bacterium]|nr:HAMP domain-containing protein [Vicinamibacteria bacterium]